MPKRWPIISRRLISRGCAPENHAETTIWYTEAMAQEEKKEKLLEVEEVKQRIEKLRTSVGEMAAYIDIDGRRKRLAELEEQQASGDFWNDQTKAKDVIAKTNAERAYVNPFDALVKTVEDAGVPLLLNFCKRIRFSSAKKGAKLAPFFFIISL